MAMVGMSRSPADTPTEFPGAKYIAELYPEALIEKEKGHPGQ
jgi:hypothetical protein